MFGLALASAGFVIASADILTFGAEGVKSRETAPNFFSPCLLRMNIKLETEPRTSRVPNIPIIRPSAWKTPLTYSRRYMLFRYSSTIHSEREKMTSDWTMIMILEADPCPAVDPVFKLETNPELPRNHLNQAMILC